MQRRSNQYKRAFFFANSERPDSGPPSLYKRVKQVLSAPRLLAIKPERLANLAKTWPMTQEEMEQVVHFDSADWTLFKVEVRLDTGKFICSTWYRWIGEKCFFVDIGFGDKIERVQWSRSDYIDDIRMWCDNDNKALVDFVEKVNATLMAENVPFSPPAHPLPVQKPEDIDWDL